MWEPTRLYHCIIPNDIILNLQCVFGRSQSKKERKSSNKAITTYTNTGAVISVGGWHRIIQSLAFWIITALVTVTVNYYRSSILFVRTDVSTTVITTVVLSMVYYTKKPLILLVVEGKFTLELVMMTFREISYVPTTLPNNKCKIVLHVRYGSLCHIKKKWIF